jgi:hypothetical protein
MDQKKLCKITKGTRYRWAQLERRFRFENGELWLIFAMEPRRSPFLKGGARKLVPWISRWHHVYYDLTPAPRGIHSLEYLAADGNHVLFRADRG